LLDSGIALQHLDPGGGPVFANEPPEPPTMRVRFDHCVQQVARSCA
jgi:hypothetical protein